MKKALTSRKRQRGSVVIGTMAFAVVITALVVGIATLTASHYTRVTNEHSFAAAMDMCEAGINWELNQMSLDINNTDSNARTVSSPMGQASTSFTVQATDRGTTNPWSGVGNPLDILCTGNVKGMIRRVRIGAKSYSMGPANYALFGITYGEIKGTSDTITGDVGTDASLNFTGHPSITGSVVFNGAGSDWASGGNPGGYTVYHYPYPVLWSTVTQLANRAFPSGGLTWLSTHNDNALAVPPIVASKVDINSGTTEVFKGKPGGANYYLNRLNCKGSSNISLDNTNGPITIWCTGAGPFDWAGGAAAIQYSVDPTKANRFYVSTTQDFNMHGTSRVDAGIYFYDGPGNNGAFTVTAGGTPDIYGQVITDTFKLNGNANIHYDGGYFSPIVLYWGFDGSWKEETSL